MPTTKPKRRGALLFLTLWLSGGAAFLFSSRSSAIEPSTSTPLATISIIIDDLGDLRDNGFRTVQLPGAVTCAFIPHTRFSKPLARAAHQLGKEVMVHMPMESVDDRRLGPGGLRLEMTKQEFTQTLLEGIAAVPYASGLNNHMGSLLTRHPGHMKWLMEGMNDLGQLYFVDSRTTPQSVALQLARENHVPSRSRDIFLDDDASATAVAHQFDLLIRQARKKGSAIAIGHPYNSTLALLERQLPRLQQMGVKLVPVSELLTGRQEPEQHLAETSTRHNTAARLVYNYRSADIPPPQPLAQ